MAGMADDDQDYQDFQKETAQRVSPTTGSKTTRYKEREAA